MTDRLQFLQSNLANLKAIRDACTMAGKEAPDWVIYKIGEVESEIAVECNIKITGSALLRSPG